MDKRPSLLDQWAQVIWQTTQRGNLGGKRPISVHGIEAVQGPRAGALEILAGLDAGRLLSALKANDFALHRQFVPWGFVGNPSVYMSGRYVRLEAGWPDSLAEKNIKLSDIGQNPRNGGRWIAGKNEQGQTVTLSLSNTVPHFLLGGYTGSGKTWAMRSAVAQLARDPQNRLILIDGKWGYGLKPLEHVANRVGPLATEHEAVRGALSWSIKEMRTRYQNNSNGRLIIAIDEIQEFTKDAAIAEMLRRLAAQGRDANIHMIVGTQDPTADAFKDVTTRRNLVGRLALHTESYKASEVVVGGPTPRADWLLGAGDAYALTPEALHRVQLAYIPVDDLSDETGGDPELDKWPDFDPEAAGTLPENSGNGGRSIDGKELAVALIQAHLGAGRPTLQRALKNAGLDKPGSTRADWLLGLGRDAYHWLEENDWSLCES